MVVDKSTGKGCAWSIASKAITKKLIAENIIDKLIDMLFSGWRNTLRACM